MDFVDMQGARLARPIHFKCQVQRLLNQALLNIYEKSLRLTNVKLPKFSAAVLMPSRATN